MNRKDALRLRSGSSTGQAKGKEGWEERSTGLYKWLWCA